jgi:predicted secreted hydrolase
MSRRSGNVRDLAARLVLLVAAALVSGCTAPILANDPIVFPSPLAPSAAPPRAPDPVPISLPRDDGPHDRLTEWWYYTGHLRTSTGRRFGFEAVVFRAERGSVPAAWAAHLALTDEAGVAFRYAQRSEVGPQVDHSPRDAAGAPTGFDVQVRGLSPTLIAAGAQPLAAAPWRLAGANGTGRIEATLAPEEATASGAAFALELNVEGTKPPAFHDGDGFVDFGPAGSSYYYSRTRLAANGMLELNGERLTVEGIAWFDHQWGDFVSVGGGGWDWFAINLDDGTDITASLVRDDRAGIVLSYAMVIDPQGGVRQLEPLDFLIGARNVWWSPRTGVIYPMGWDVMVGDDVIHLDPTVSDQELDTRATTGVVYWEGSQVVTGTRAGSPIGGEAYIEITRYDAGNGGSGTP